MSLSASKISKRVWVTPTFEQQSLKDALGGGGGIDDSNSGYS